MMNDIMMIILGMAIGFVLTRFYDHTLGGGGGSGGF